MLTVFGLRPVLEMWKAIQPFDRVEGLIDLRDEILRNRIPHAGAENPLLPLKPKLPEQTLPESPPLPSIAVRVQDPNANPV
jgi:hypothetical protein